MQATYSDSFVLKYDLQSCVHSRILSLLCGPKWSRDSTDWGSELA